jgi:hypothetical protein
MRNIKYFFVYLGDCEVCGCHWLQHKHITYECNTRRTHVMSDTSSYNKTNKPMSLSDIDKRIGDLREEQRQIQDVYKTLARFLHANSILPINDDFLDYLRYFIREEQMKQTEGARNTEVIASLEKMMTDFISDMDLFKKAVQDQSGTANSTKAIEPEKIFDLVGTLYHLPITGKQIRQQVEGIKIGQEKYSNKRENYVELPAKAAESMVMRRLTGIVAKDANE